MLDKAQALMKARKIQGEFKKQMEQIFHQEEKGDNVILVRGDKHIENVVVDGEERKDLKDLLNEALKNVDKKVEKKTRDQRNSVLEMLGQ